MKPIKDQPFFCSWSGGKDSCLALYHAVRSGGIPRALLSMFREDGERSRGHGLSAEIIRQQARSLGIPLSIGNASWNDYEDIFLSLIRGFSDQGIGYGVFGDIDLDPHLEWIERVCSMAAVKPYEPLWKRPRRELLEEFLDLGFTSIIVVVKEDALDRSFLGRQLDRNLVLEMENAGIDASGEEGEYHTIVTGGPLFAAPIRIKSNGMAARDGYCFLDVEIVSDDNE